MKTSVVLTEAKKLLEERGWIQNEIGDEERGFCIVGVLDKVTSRYSDGTYSKASKFVLRSIAKFKHRPYALTSVSNWNDSPRRTKEQVLRVFDKAIKLAEKEESRVSE